MSETLPAVSKDTPLGPKQVMSEQRWTKFLGLIAGGMLARAALAELGSGRRQLEGIIREPKRKQAYDEAKLVALRSIWDEETVDEILSLVAMNERGGILKDVIEERGLDAPSFYRLLLRDPDIRQMYEEARQIQMEVMADEIKQIADDGTNDTYTDDKGHVRVDNDVVQRSKVRIDTRKWVMARLHHKRFGDRIQQDVNANIVVDHASRLEEARKRREALNASRGEVTNAESPTE